MDNRETPEPAAARWLALFGVAAIVGMVALVFGTAIWYTASADQPPPKPAPVPDTPRAANPELRSRLLASYRQAADFLVARQTPKGAWKFEPVESPALTALALDALCGAPPELQAAYRGHIEKGFAWLVGTQNDDGSFSEAGGLMKTYATSVALMAMSHDRHEYDNAIRKGQAWLKRHQTDAGFAAGGSGYGDKDIKSVDGRQDVVTKKENMSTSAFTADAMQASGLPKDDPYWELVTQYMRANQNSSETNIDKELVAALEAAGYRVGDDGGFVYAFGESKAAPDPNDPQVPRSYGSMTYAGLKTYLYAGLKKDAPEVKAAMGWIRRAFSVERHPGFEFDGGERPDLQGLYYYYVMMAKCLDAYGERPLLLEDGTTRDWPVELAEKLLSMQKDGAWTNPNSRWFEDNPVMVTAYALDIYNILLKHVGA